MRLKIAFDGGQIIMGAVTIGSADELERALADGAEGTVALDATNAKYLRPVAPRRLRRESAVSSSLTERPVAFVAGSAIWDWPTVQREEYLAKIDHINRQLARGNFSDQSVATGDTVPPSPAAPVAPRSDPWARDLAAVQPRGDGRYRYRLLQDGEAHFVEARIARDVAARCAAGLSIAPPRVRFFRAVMSGTHPHTFTSKTDVGGFVLRGAEPIFVREGYSTEYLGEVAAHETFHKARPDASEADALAYGEAVGPAYAREALAAYERSWRSAW